MKKITAELKEEYKLTFHNKDYAMGHYYSEDDWDICVYAESFKQLKLKMCDEMVETDIYVNSTYLEKVETIHYNGKRHEHKVLEEEDWDDNKAAHLYQEILDSSYYKKLVREKEDAQALKEAEEENQAQKECEEKEQAELKRLIKKYKG